VAVTLVATLPEFKSWLNYTGTADDTEQTMVLTAASEWVEYAIGGPLSVAAFTEQHIVEGWFIQPNKRPLVAVTSITPDQGTALDVSTYLVDSTANIVRVRSWLCGLYTLVYTAGLSTILNRQKLAGLEVARHLWLIQNGSAGRGYPGDDVVPTPMGFAVPRRALELLEPDRQVLIA
jgi:hypothetical protein